MFAAFRDKTRRESSPTRFSEISLRRYRKKLSRSKKSSAVMSADEETVTGHRTVSLSTLSLNEANSGKVDSNGHGPSLARLQTVEKKMASIENSLGTPPNHPATRKKKDSIVSNNNSYIPAYKDMEVLQAALREKDQLIFSLRSQLMAACQMRSSQEAERLAKERERTVLQERLTHLQQQVERRKAHVKNLRLSLEKLEASENIDNCIKQAELEYEVEREELNILNLQGEEMTLRAKLEDIDNFNLVPSKVSLSSCLPSSAETSLHLATLHYDPRSPSFTVSSHVSGVGVLVEWALDDSGLRKGDRFLEVNGRNVFGLTKDAFVQLLGGGGGGGGQPAGPLRLLAVRCQPASQASRRAQALRQELALLADRLEQKTRENKQLHAEKERCCQESDALRTDNQRLAHRISYLEEQVHELQSDLDKIKGVTDESMRRAKKDVQVFTKGPHTATIPVNVDQQQRAEAERPLSPRAHSDIVSVSRQKQQQPGPPSEHRPHIYQNIRPKIKQKPSNILQRLQQFSERRPAAGAGTDSEASGAAKPRPPKKPARLSLSLQRTTSVQSVKSADDTLGGGSEAAGRRRHQRTDLVVQTWPSVDRNLDQVRDKSCTPRSLYHNIASLPRLARKERGASGNLTDSELNR